MMPALRHDVAIVHDYLTQRGGAERVVLSMLRAFPGAPLITSLYDPSRTFPELADADVHPLLTNRLSLLRRHHRLALPLLAPAFSATVVDAAVALVSSSGWAHGVRSTGRKVVVCHAPGRWLYQPHRYLRGRPWPAAAGLAVLSPALRRWDRRAAGSADRYLAVSTAVRESIRELYGIEAELFPPAHTVQEAGPAQEVAGVEPGYWLCVARLLPYKNVDAVIGAVDGLPEVRLAVVGTGPEERRLRGMASRRVRLLGGVSDAELRWLYRNCEGLVTASYEDFGLTPLEAGVFGRPVAALRAGGFVDTVVEEVTGVLFDVPEPAAIREAIRHARSRTWDAQAIRAHADRFSEASFIARLRRIVAEERIAAGLAA
jgi:glycosyltransferase involved in cell wall biosynthesis